MSYHTTSAQYERPHPILSRGYGGVPDRHLGKSAATSTMAYSPDRQGRLYGYYQQMPGTSLASVPPLSEPIYKMGQVVHPETGSYHTPSHIGPTGPFARREVTINDAADPCGTIPLPFSCYQGQNSGHQRDRQRQISEMNDPYHAGIPIGTLGATTVSHPSIQHAGAHMSDMHTFASYSALNANSRNNFGLSKVGRY